MPGVHALRHARPVLHERIESRVASMFEAGLLDEVRGLLDKHGTLGQTAAQAVGYREAIDHLEERMPLDETIEKVRVRTRRFARHQETWFRGLSECRMIDLPTEFDSDRIAEQLVASA